MQDTTNERALESVSKVVFSKTDKTSQEAYDQWSKNYDEELTALAWSGPEEVAKMFKKHVKDCSDVLDIGSGTGMVISSLQDIAEFEGNVDILDANLSLLIQAENKGLGMRNIIRHWIDEKGELPVKDEVYDVMTCAGSFVPNHIPSSALKGMIKAVKQGGLIIFTTRSRSVETYKREFDSDVQTLIKDEKIELIDQEEFVHFKNSKDTVMSVVYVARKL